MSAHPVSHYFRTYKTTPSFAIQDLIEVIPSLSYADRKKLMTVARARCFPKRGTTLHRMTWPTISRLSRLYPWMKEQLALSITTPMKSGFLLSALLSAPYESSDVRRIKKELMWKEVSVMESIPRKPSICWFNIYCLLDPLSSEFKTSSIHNRILQRSLQKWIHRHSGKVLYPSMGNKAVSFESRMNLETYLRREVDPEFDVTSTTLEHYYSRSGLRVDGACEMKQKWYPTQASPRTYYAQGGDAYHSSKYLRDSFNWLCDSFRPTNRIDRVSFSGLTLSQSEDDVYIYDLTSFTSLFHEHRSFLIFLACITSEVIVTIFDSWEGPVFVTLGSLIFDYLEKNVSQPSYSTRIPELSDLKLAHSIAGFLGVYGNLATCTYPHGISLSTVTGSDNRSWCAGDDAGSADVSESSGFHTKRVAETVGSIAIDKVFIASEEGSLALKRPISLISSVIFQHRNILWPIFSIMCDSDPRYNLVAVHADYERVLGAIVSFLRSCEICPLSLDDIEFATDFFQSFYRRYGLPCSGWYPPLTGYHPWKLSIPKMDKSVFGRNPLQVLVESFFGTEYVAALVEELPWQGNSGLYLGNSWRSNSNEHLSYLVKLGYISREVCQCLYEGKDGFQRAVVDATRPQAKYYVYEFEVIEPIPQSLMSVSSSE